MCTHPCEHRVCSGAALLAQQQCPKRPALLYYCRLSAHPLPPRLSDCPGTATRAPALPQAAPRPCSSVWVQCRWAPGAKAAPGWCCPESGRWAGLSRPSLGRALHGLPPWESPPLCCWSPALSAARHSLTVPQPCRDQVYNSPL